jgi:hypothetical protein
MLHKAPATQSGDLATGGRYFRRPITDGQMTPPPSIGGMPLSSRYRRMTGPADRFIGKGAAEEVCA